MICFEFIIFALSITADAEYIKSGASLWFASNLLFLHYQSQQYFRKKNCCHRCDLLRIYYFCTINHSNAVFEFNNIPVVICFEFIIFALSITAIPSGNSSTISLWFASNLLFLHYQSQLKELTSIPLDCCDLLRIYYFCTINHSRTAGMGDYIVGAKLSVYVS